MAAKTFFVICASVLMVKSISAQCIGYGSGVGNLGLANNLARGGCGLGLSSGLASSGGGLTVTSTSPIAPTGVTVISDNAIEGPVEIGGKLPMLSAVNVEGKIPTGGEAGAQYSCGNGNVGISSQSLGAAGIGAGGLAGAGLAGNALIGNGLASNGLAGNGLIGANRLGLGRPIGCSNVC